MMALISYYNPLAPIATKTEQINATNTKEIRNNFIYDDVAYDLVIAKNDEILEYDCEIVENDIIGVLLVPRGGGGGGGKQILSIVASIAIMVASPYLAGAINSYYGLALTKVGVGMLGASIAATGSILMSAIFAPNFNIDSSSYSDNSIDKSSTYGWNTQTNQINEGDVIPRLYGTSRIFPRAISKYVETIDDKQYLNILLLVNDGVTTSIENLQINDESISNFQDVTYERRYGTNDQPIISRFDNIRTDKSVSKKLTTAYSTANTDGDQVVALEVGVSFPRGLFYANDNGNLSDATVKIKVEYSTDQINWTQFGDDSSVTTYSSYWHYEYDFQNDIYRFVNYLTQDIYSDQIAFSDNLPDGVVYIGDDWYGVPIYNSYDFTTITRATSSTFRKTFKLNYLAPNKYYIRASLVETPPIGTRYTNECYFEYITEEVGDDFTYPNMALVAIRALATDQLNGGMPTISCVATSRTSNPALICKDILINSGVDESRISHKFDEWADYCTNNGLTCNIYFDTKMSVREALNTVSVLGRASVAQFGSKFDVILDKAETLPVQGFTFGVGNILKDSFKQSFLPLKDRANIIETTFYNEENDYQKEVFELSNSQFDDIDETNKASINLIGCTNKTQAIALAKLQLNYNNYITQTFTFQADADALYCKVGDIVRISHDVPQYGFSGRVVSCTSESVVIDREVAMVSGKSYALQARRNSNNEIIEVSVVNSENTTNTLTFATPIATALNQYDNYSFGEVNKTDIKARVLSIRTDGELLRELTCVEYNESVYDTEHTPYIENISSLALSNLRVNDYIKYSKDGSIETVVNITWSGESLYYDVSIDNQTVRVYDKVYDAYGLVDGQTYTIKVKGGGSTLSQTYTVLGKFAKPNAVTNLKAVSTAGVLVVSWDKNTDIDFGYYEIKTQGKTYTTVLNSITLSDLDYIESTVDIYVYDTSGIKSDPSSVNYSHREKSIIDLMADAYQIEQGFLDGKINLYWGQSEPIAEQNYDLWAFKYEDMTIADYSSASAFLQDKNASFFDSGVQYRYFWSGYWYTCTPQQEIVIQRMLRYVTQSSVADGLVRIFNKQPFVPYEVGDLWIDGDTIKVCTTNKYE